MEAGELGRTYQDGEVVVQEGEQGDRMYVIQSGRVAVTRRTSNQDVIVAQLGVQDVFGEMALFEREPRSATVRAIGPVRVLSVDRKTFLRRVHEDPSLAYRILQQMSQRIREADNQLARLRLRTDGDKAADLDLVPRRSRFRKRVEILQYFLAMLRGPRGRARRPSEKAAATGHSARPEQAEDKGGEGQRSNRGTDNQRKVNRRGSDRRRSQRRASERRVGDTGKSSTAPGAR